MFDVVVMPLTELLCEDDATAEERAEILAELQGVLSEQCESEKVQWSETPQGESDGFDAERLEPYCLYALRAFAATLEIHGDVAEFEVGDTPWEHAAFDALEDAKGASDAFPQLLHSNAGAVAFVPAVLADIFFIGSGDEGEEEEEDGDLAVGSIPTLKAELEVLRGHLNLELDSPATELGALFDDSEDPLAAVKFGWVVLNDAITQAEEEGLPVILLYNEDGDEDEDSSSSSSSSSSDSAEKPESGSDD